MKSTSSFGRTSSRLSNYSRTFDLPDDDLDGSETASDCEIGGAMLPIFLNDLRRNNQDELVEVTLELEKDSIVVCSVNPNGRGMSTPSTPGGGAAAGILERSLSATSRIRRKFGWLRSRSSRTTWSENEERAISARDARKLKAKLDRSKLSAQRGLKGLRFINKTTGTTSESNELWKRVESRFKLLSKDGLLAREDFGECIGK
jgi:respiratory burst oxidase